jgi:hypothetical protein
LTKKVIYAVLGVFVAIILIGVGFGKQAKQQTKWAWNPIRGAEHFCSETLAKDGNRLTVISPSLYVMMTDGLEEFYRAQAGRCGSASDRGECFNEIANRTVQEIEVWAQGQIGEKKEVAQAIAAGAMRYRQLVDEAYAAGVNGQEVLSSYEDVDFFDKAMNESIGAMGCEVLGVGLMLAHLRIVEDALFLENASLRGMVLRRERRGAISQWFES